MSLSDIKIIIVEKRREISNIILEHFKDIKNVEIVRSDISQTGDTDCIVAGSNSYGLFDCGVDKTINMLIGDIQLLVKQYIENIYYGEQPVGTSIILKTDNSKYRHIAYVPTMRYPHDVSNTHNAYYAFRALLISVINHNRNNNNNKIKTILCTPFCTGHGKMDANNAGKQMRLAYGFIDIQLKCSWENAKIINQLLEYKK